jgi:hypothetical protein
MTARMHRREFIALLGAAAACPIPSGHVASAYPPGRLRRALPPHQSRHTVLRRVVDS